MKTKKIQIKFLTSQSFKRNMGIFAIVAFSFFLAFPREIFALTIGIDFGGSNGTSAGWALSNSYGLPTGTILGITTNLLYWLLSIFAITGIIGFVLSGVFYLISAGEEDMVKRGKDGMKWSIVGILVGLSGFVIMQALNSFLGGASRGF
jgi:hypothetical protein